MSNKRIKDLATTITAFRTGDVIPVDGPIGTAKMGKDDLLRATAENALGSIHSLSDTATEADLVSGNYLAIDGSAGTKKLPANIVPACKIIDRGSASVATINALSFKQNGWSYTVTDSGTLSAGSLAVSFGDVVVWDAQTTSWKMLETRNFTTFVQGTIGAGNGTNYAANDAIRSGYIATNNLFSVISVPSGYLVRAVIYYSSTAQPPGPANYVTYDGVFEAGTTSVLVPPKSAYFRIVVKKDDGSDFTPSGFVARLNSLDALTDKVNLLETKIHSEMSGKVDVVGANVVESFAQGSIGLYNGSNANANDAIRSSYIAVGGYPLILGGIPSGYYIHALIYYTSTAYPPGPANYAGYDGPFDAGTRSVFVSPKSSYVRIVIKKDDGSDLVPSDVDIADIHKDSYSYIFDALNTLYGNVKGKLNGLKLIVTGDSIPHGQVWDGPAPASPYPNLVAQALGMSLVNYAIGGSTFAQSSDFGGTFNSYADFAAAVKDTSKIYVVLTGNQTFQNYAYSDGSWSITATQVRTPISSRYQFMTDDADIVLVNCGTNDFQYDWTALGTMADRTPDTFYGALHYTILGLLDKYLGKQIVFCTPIKRAQTPYTSVDSKNGNDKTLGDYGEIIKEVCDYYSIPVIDLYAQSCLNPSVASQSSLFDSYKTHPYQTGHNMIARVVAGQLMALRGAPV